MASMLKGQQQISTPSFEDPDTPVANLVGSYDSEDESKPLITEKKQSMWRPPLRRYVPIEIISVGYFFSAVLCLPLLQYYIVAKISEEYGSANSSTSGPCSTTNSTGGDNSIAEKVQDKAAEYTVFLLFTISFPGVIQTFFLGAMSDGKGRRGSLMLAIGGLFLRQIIYLIVFQFDLPLWCLFIGNAVDGLSGSFGTVLMALLGMIADITAPGFERAKRLVIFQASIALSSAMGNLIVGFWIDAAGFKQPLYLVITLTALTWLFVIFILPETRRKRNAEPISFKEHFKSFKRAIQLYTKDTLEKRRIKLIVSLMTFVCSFSIMMTLATILLLYLLAAPFCLTRSEISGYAAARTFLNWICIFLLTSLCGRRISEANIAIIGCISNAVFLLMIGFTDSTVVVILAGVFGIFSEATPPMVRSIMSRLVSPDEQGALFASISGVEMLATSVIGVGSSVIYKASLSFFPGLIFVILAGLIVITALLLGTLSCAFKTNSETSGTETTVEEPTLQPETK